jgi:hypothetical protein
MVFDYEADDQIKEAKRRFMEDNPNEMRNGTRAEQEKRTA